MDISPALIMTEVDRRRSGGGGGREKEYKARVN